MHTGPGGMVITWASVLLADASSPSPEEAWLLALPQVAFWVSLIPDLISEEFVRICFF